eukprot:SAG11_NODE_5351_length_1587_cov_1.038306_3_plen_33_part_00
MSLTYDDFDEVLEHDPELRNGAATHATATWSL